MKTENATVETIPHTGISSDELLDEIDRLGKEDIDWIHGRTWSLIYYIDEEHEQLLRHANEKFFSSNYLNPLAFKSLKTMELDVVKMTAGLLHGDEDIVGTMSSGGTESILLALYTYREWARKHHPKINHPEIVAPDTIHPAHDKAAHMFGLKIRKAKTDTGQVADPRAMEKLINDNTILLCASAPSYANGVLDPIIEIGELATKYKLPFHVDSCIGGFILPWIEMMGINVPFWDFRVPGVTSISADVHKFGYAAKGASVILYRSIDYLKYQFFITTDFPGGIYVSPTILGTRPGGPIAAAWSSIKHLGIDGYLKLTKQLMTGRDKLEIAINNIPELYIIGEPCMNILSYTTHDNDPDIFAVGDFMEKQGWMVDRQQLPDCIHLTILPTNVKAIDRYISDLKDAINYARENPRAPGEGNAALYGMMARIPFRGMVEKNVRHIFEEMYSLKSSDKNEGNNRIMDTPGWMRRLSRFLARIARI